MNEATLWKWNYTPCCGRPFDPGAVMLIGDSMQFVCAWCETRHDVVLGSRARLEQSIKEGRRDGLVWLAKVRPGKRRWRGWKATGRVTRWQTPRVSRLAELDATAREVWDAIGRNPRFNES